jgi:2-keto-3-deoxy-L-rhamnonate aldolase RhmA
MPSGYYADTWGYVMRANAEVVVIVQCEHIRAVEALPEILQVPGIDCVFIGPADLTGSLHRLPDTGNPETQAAIARVAALCRSAGVTCGIDADPAGVPPYHDMGIRLFTIATDTGFLQSGAAAAVAFRASIAGS